MKRKAPLAALLLAGLSLISTTPASARDIGAAVATGGRGGIGQATDGTTSYSFGYLDPSGTKEEAATGYPANFGRLHTEIEIISGAGTVVCATVVNPDDSGYDDPNFFDWFDFSCGDNQGWQNYRVTMNPSGSQAHSTTGTFSLPCTLGLVGTVQAADLAVYGFDGANYMQLATTDPTVGAAEVTQLNSATEYCSQSLAK
ncbi:MAG: hypothetical protein ACYDAY_06025 [Candidatus Dormibacteria bacterium]